MRQGIYAARVNCGDGAWLPAAISIGMRPTVNPTPACLLEAHLLDVDRDLYGRRIEVRPVKFLREERHFEDLEALRQQMNEDIRATRALL